ncbi:MAG: 2Fe-2S iron-sulfur cluster-binding protein [Proteobacteria bacterium]|nr:2Fe-2S iron-sulfur cluster-binding protein [Pseudomonadota bacterium]
MPGTVPQSAAEELEPLEVAVPAGTSILDAAEHCGAHVGSACGGNLACSTCHVWVLRGYDSLSEIEDAEDDIMDKAFDVREESRLGCQARLSGQDIVVEISPESLQAWLDEHPSERKKAG